MLHTIYHKGFHGTKKLTFRGNDIIDYERGGNVSVSAAVARRLNRAVCGMPDCSCGEHVAHQYDQGDWRRGWYVEIPPYGVIDGNYAT